MDGFLSMSSLKTNIAYGQDKFIPFKDFEGFQKPFKGRMFRIDNDDYKKYTEKNIGDLIFEFNHMQDRDEKNIFEDKPNAFYLKKILTEDTGDDFDLNAHDFGDYAMGRFCYQIIVNPELVNSDYLIEYFNKGMGNESLEQIISKNGRIHEKDIKKINIVFPPLPDQKLNAETKKNIKDIKSSLRKYQVDLKNNPGNLIKINKEIKKFFPSDSRKETVLIKENKSKELLIKSALIGIKDINTKNIILGIFEEHFENPIIKLSKATESQTLEFKSSYRKPLGKKIPEKILKHSVIKTIAAFANTKGGDLLIGVSDNNEIIGIEVERYKNMDSVLLAISPDISKKLDTNPMAISGLITITHVEKDGKTICRVNVRPANRPIYVKQDNVEALYCRYAASSEPLKLSELFSYIRERFPDHS